MAHRHEKHKAKGGKVMVDDGPESVIKEAKEKKTGGRIVRKDGGKVPGKKSGGRIDKFARGGHVEGSGKDMTHSPFSSAHVAAAPAHNPAPHGSKGE